MDNSKYYGFSFAFTRLHVWGFYSKCLQHRRPCLICLSVFVCVGISLHVRVFVLTRMHMYVYVCLRALVCVCVCMSVNERTCVCTYVRVCARRSRYLSIRKYESKMRVLRERCLFVDFVYVNYLCAFLALHHFYLEVQLHVLINRAMYLRCMYILFSPQLLNYSLFVFPLKTIM